MSGTSQSILEFISPIGPLWLSANDVAIVGIHFEDPKIVATSNHVLDLCARQLREYFAGSRSEFHLPLATDIISPFRRDVTKQLLDIGFGKTTNYGAIAQKLGGRGFARAVGSACRLNPWPIVVPCHRVVNANGDLHGFSGGLWRKKALLAHESRVGVGMTTELASMT
jgi:methylated-DNA-[protein]-cysteine S-methyltransferase